MSSYNDFCNDYLRNKTILPGRESLSSSNTLRQKILLETIQAFSSPNNYHSQSLQNLVSWTKVPLPLPVVDVCPLDWGDATLHYTKTYGHIFTVLNMANPIYPGGGYLDGCVAQEENIFRRSDCHFSINDNFDHESLKYTQNFTDLLSAKHGVVYLDTIKPRVCIRGPENRNKNNLGYEWLSQDQIFPFFEMRASAQNCYYEKFDTNEADHRIHSQFRTLLKNNIQHAILGAFGCGAFNNPPEKIASIYNKYIRLYQHKFKVIVFAIYNAGYGPDNHTIFKNIISPNEY